MSGECYYYMNYEATFAAASQTCQQRGGQLPVPMSEEDSEYISTIGSTFLGISGLFDDGIITWMNIYTNVGYE